MVLCLDLRCEVLSVLRKGKVLLGEELALSLRCSEEIVEGRPAVCESVIRISKYGGFGKVT